MENKSCVLVGGGTSIEEGIEKDLWNKIKNHDVWSLNFAYKSLPYYPRREIWVDIVFFNNNSAILPNLYQKGVKLFAKSHSRYTNIPEIKQYHTTRNKSEYYGKEAIEKNRLYIGRMGLCGIFAISLAVAEAYNTIYILGYDFGVPNFDTRRTHFYQDKINVLSSGMGKPEIYLKPDGRIKEEVEDFEIFTKEKDIKIYNVSIISNIPYYEKISYDEFYKKLEGKND